MYEVLLTCKHSRYFTKKTDMPKVGAERYCLFCKVMQSVAEIVPYWHAQCKQCTFSMVRTNRMGCASIANRHMLRQRHTVICYKSDSVEATLFVVQPATSAQERLEIKQDDAGTELVDEPPF